MDPAMLAVLFGGQRRPPGPLDLVTGWAYADSSARRLGYGYTGALVRLRESGANNEGDIGYLPNGNLNTAAAAALIGANSGFYTTKYDQSGNARNATQATAGNQPLYVASAQGGRPTARYDGSDDYLLANGVAAGFGGSDTPATIITAIRYASFAGATNVPWAFGRSSTANGVFNYASTTTPEHRLLRLDDSGGLKQMHVGTPTMALAIVSCVFTGTVGRIFVNGVQVGSDGDLDVGTMTFDRFALGATVRSTISGYLAGDMPETLVHPSALSTANRQLIERNMGAYYGVTVA